MNLRSFAFLPARLAHSATVRRPSRLALAVWVGSSAALALAALPDSSAPADGKAVTPAAPMVASPASPGPASGGAPAPQPGHHRPRPDELNPRDQAELDRMVAVAGLSDLQKGQIKELMLLAHPPFDPHRRRRDQPRAGAPGGPGPDPRDEGRPGPGAAADARPGPGWRRAGPDGEEGDRPHPREGRGMGMNRREFHRALKAVFTPEQWAKYQAARAVPGTARAGAKAAPAA